MMDADTKVINTAAVFFKVKGLLRFLSHQETARMFRRAIARAGLDIQFSEGFNPHPKMSLPLPRSVAMASECELLQFNLYSNGQADANVYEALSQQMPRDIEITEVKMFGEKVKFNPAAITYFLPFDMNTATREKIGNIKDAFDAGLPLMTERVSHKTGKRKSVDLAELIRTIEELDDGVLMSVKMVNGTTVKLDEMPALFGIDSSQLRGAVVRKKIEWEVK